MTPVTDWFCTYCGKRARGAMNVRNAEHYRPYCTYACQQYDRLQQARDHLREVRSGHEGGA